MIRKCVLRRAELFLAVMQKHQKEQLDLKLVNPQSRKRRRKERSTVIICNIGIIA